MRCIALQSVRSGPAVSGSATAPSVDVSLIWFRPHVRRAICGRRDNVGSTGARLAARTRRSLFSGLALKRSQTSPSTQMQHGRVATCRGVVRPHTGYRRGPRPPRRRPRGIQRIKCAAATSVAFRQCINTLSQDMTQRTLTAFAAAILHKPFI